MTTPLETAWRQALRNCPCCRAQQREQNTPDDCIPEGNKVEIVFACGAAVFITDKDETATGRACTFPMDQRLNDMAEDVEELAQQAEADAS